MHAGNGLHACRLHARARRMCVCAHERGVRGCALDEMARQARVCMCTGNSVLLFGSIWLTSITHVCMFLFL